MVILPKEKKYGQRRQHRLIVSQIKQPWAEADDLHLS
jgi:hypothetical protein